MIRIAAALAAIVFCGLFVFYNETSTAAQSRITSSRGLRETGSEQLAKIIRERTSRDARGLKEARTKDGGITVDLEGRFDNVMLARLDAYGEPVAACVSDIAEANLFFGRDLETGELLPTRDLLTREVQANAKRHGMSVEEYRFYSGLATEFASGSIVSSPASATFNIVNNDGPGEGFNDGTAAFVIGEGGNVGTTRGQQRLNVFNAAAAVWASFLDSSVPTNVRSNFNPIAGCTASGGVLGSASTINVHRDFPGAEFSGTWYHAALANKRFGADLSAANPEMQAQFNTDIDSGCLGTGTRFYYGLDNATPSGRINLFVVVLHEIGHGVGFSSFGNGSTGALFSGYPDIYMRYMWDESVDMYWHQMTDAQRQASAVNVNNVFWDGPSVRIASGYLTGGRQSGTNRVALYTPNPLQGGSSISHFSTAASPNLLMEPNISSGLSIDLDLARQVMRDIGWYRDTTPDVVEDTVTNVVPDGNSLVFGESQAIFWTNTGGFDRNVTIEFSTDGGVTYSPIATNVVNTGSYPWTVPHIATNQARIRVREAGFASPSAVSSFSILATPGAAPAAVSGRVLHSSGRAVFGAVVTFVADNGASYYARTNSFGYFRIEGLKTGRTYLGTVAAKGMSFAAQSLSVEGNMDPVLFISSN